MNARFLLLSLVLLLAPTVPASAAGTAANPVPPPAAGAAAPGPEKAPSSTPFGGGDRDTLRELQYEAEIEERSERERDRIAEERRKEVQKEAEDLQRERDLLDYERGHVEDLRRRQEEEIEKKAKERQQAEARKKLEEEERGQRRDDRRYGNADRGPGLEPPSSEARGEVLRPETAGRRRGGAPLAPNPIPIEGPGPDIGGRAQTRARTQRAPVEDPADLYLPDDLRPLPSEPAPAVAPPPARAAASAPPPAVRGKKKAPPARSAASEPATAPPPTARAAAPPANAVREEEPTRTEEPPPVREAEREPPPERPYPRERAVAQGPDPEPEAYRYPSQTTTLTGLAGQDYFSPVNFAITVNYANARYSQYVLDGSGALSGRDSHGVHLGFEWMAVQSVGKIGVGAGVGYITMPKTSTALSSEVRVTFVPIDIGLSYRFDYFRHQPVVPFVRGGVTVLSVSNQIDSGSGLASQGSQTYFGFDASAGLQFNLQWLGPVDAVMMDRRYGINDTYLVAELLYSQPVSRTSGGPNLEHREIRVGLRFEF